MTIWRTRIACWIPKATNKHLENITLTPFPLQQWLHDRASTLRYTYTVVLFNSLLLSRMVAVITGPWRHKAQLRHWGQRQVPGSCGAVYRPHNGLEGSGLEPGLGQEIYFLNAHPDRPWDPPILLYNGYLGCFPGPGRGVDHPPLSRPEIRHQQCYTTSFPL